MRPVIIAALRGVLDTAGVLTPAVDAAVTFLSEAEERSEVSALIVQDIAQAVLAVLDDTKDGSGSAERYTAAFALAAVDVCETRGYPQGIELLSGRGFYLPDELSVETVTAAFRAATEQARAALTAQTTEWWEQLDALTERLQAETVAEGVSVHAATVLAENGGVMTLPANSAAQSLVTALNVAAARKAFASQQPDVTPQEILGAMLQVLIDQCDNLPEYTLQIAQGVLNSLESAWVRRDPPTPLRVVRDYNWVAAAISEGIIEGQMP